MTFFGLKYGQDLENRAAHPHQEFPGVPPQDLRVPIVSNVGNEEIVDL